MKIKVKDNAAKVFAKNNERFANGVRKAQGEAAISVATETQERCRYDIAAAGRFGPRWQNGLNSTPSAIDRGVQVTTTMSGRGWRAFQEGAVRQGNPLLWIPFSREDSSRYRRSKYPYPLTESVSRRGLPLLISTADHRPKYFGKQSVTIPKKFHLVEIAQEVGSTIADRYLEAFERQ